ncbi:MAG TPA: ATP-binding protein [Chthoniobacterales bacterium]|jgi:PAS domain S-box-containing protein
MTAQKELERASAGRADELFRRHQHEIYCKTDVLFARLMLFQWVVGIVAALVVSPLTWSGQSSQIHIHVWAMIFLGGLITLFPVWLTRVWPGAVGTRYVIAVAQMLMSSLLISVSGGRIETHFHIFGSLVILSFYRDWRVLIPATIVVGLDHFLRGIYWPYSVYGVLSASPWRSIEHSAWVIFEDVFLVISCLRSITEMCSIANRTAALEASEQNFRQIFEEAPIGMAVVGLDERFRQANAAFCQMVDYSQEELITRTPLDITDPEDVAPHRQWAQEMLSSNGSNRVEKRYRRKGGEVVWSTRSGCIIRDGVGEPRHFLIMVEDISERKRAEAALREAKEEADRANCAKSEFLSRMSHELRTPLNAILGFGQLLEGESPTESQSDAISHILGAGRHLLELINEVLDISGIEAGRLQLSVEPVSVAEAIRQAVDLMRPLAVERAIEICLPLRIDDRLHVLADRQRLRQVLLNLLTNGMKYTRVGGMVRVSVDERNWEKIRLIVSDTGVGIPTEKFSRLFTPFDRLGAEYSNVQGTGLGLALCRRLMEAMKGCIAVESTPGRGSSFSIELPRAPLPIESLTVHEPAIMGRLSESVGPEKRTILCIEDNPSSLTLIRRILAKRPAIELLTTVQGSIGLELARQQRPDLILLDLHLPDLPGWEILAQLQACHETRSIPVIVISADATARQIDRLLSAGARAYLTKPIDVAEFSKVMGETLNSVKEGVAA